MNFWSNPENDSLKTIIIIIVIAIAGFFAFTYFHKNALENAGRVVSTKSQGTEKTPAPSIPASKTLPVTLVTATSATFTGSIAGAQTDGVSPSFVYGTTPSYGQTVTATVKQDGTLTATVSGLKCHTAYYYRTMAASPNGRTYGAAQKFTTLACAPGKLAK